LGVAFGRFHSLLLALPLVTNSGTRVKFTQFYSVLVRFTQFRAVASSSREKEKSISVQIVPDNSRQVRIGPDVRWCEVADPDLSGVDGVIFRSYLELSGVRCPLLAWSRKVLRAWKKILRGNMWNYVEIRGTPCGA
jgi:hypothetical protein